jgi:predicted MPP superfamily phosphohydrolase
VRLPRLPAAFDGLRIVQVSDLHVGPHTSRRHLARAAAAVRHARPDILVHTGDQVDDFARDVEHFVAAFGDMKAPLGVFAVAGNHDVIAGWDGVRQGLADAGITVLVNEAVHIERSGERIWLAGTGDPAGHSWHRGGGASAAPDIERTLERIPPGEPTVALAHNPALWPDLARRGVDLTLSGHTHYGQLAIPEWGWNIASTFLDLSMGIHRQGESLLYISPGTNYWGVPFRIGTPPEVTVLTLKQAAPGTSPSIDPTPGGIDDAPRRPA